MDVYANYMIQQNGIRQQQQAFCHEKQEVNSHTGASSLGTGKLVAMPLLQQTGKVFYFKLSST
jgi:hypothetical protein